MYASCRRPVRPCQIHGGALLFPVRVQEITRGCCSHKNNRTHLYLNPPDCQGHKEDEVSQILEASKHCPRGKRPVAALIHGSVRWGTASGTRRQGWGLGQERRERSTPALGALGLHCTQGSNSKDSWPRASKRRGSPLPQRPSQRAEALLRRGWAERGESFPKEWKAGEKKDRANNSRSWPPAYKLIESAHHLERQQLCSERESEFWSLTVLKCPALLQGKS